MKNQLALFIIALIFSSIACSITYEASFKSMTDSVDAVKKNIQNNKIETFDGEVLDQVANRNNDEAQEKYSPKATRKSSPNNTDDKVMSKVGGSKVKFVNEGIRKVMEEEKITDDNPSHMHNNKKFRELTTKIDKLEDREKNLKEEDIKPEEKHNLLELKEKLQKVIEEHNEKYQPEGFKDTKSLYDMNKKSERHGKLAEQKLSEDDIQAELSKEDKVLSNTELPKRLVPSQEAFNNGSMLKSVYGTYKMPKRAWYYAQQFNLWTGVGRYNRNIWNRQFRLPTSMKELEIQFEFIFVSLSSAYRYSSHSTNAVSVVIDRIKLKEVSFTDTSQYRGYGRWICEKYVITAKLFNVPSGDHMFRLFMRSPNGSYNAINYAGYYSPYDKRSKIMMIGHPEE
jgi:hypothetical protein